MDLNHMTTRTAPENRPLAYFITMTVISIGLVAIPVKSLGILVTLIPSYTVGLAVHKILKSSRAAPKYRPQNLNGNALG